MKYYRMLKSEFPKGAQVMIRDEMRTGKATARYEGPFTVVRREGSGNYSLKGLDGTEYSRPPQLLKLVSPEIVKDLVVPNTIFASVKEIVAHKEIGGIVYYMTRWNNQGESQDSWLKREDFVDYGPLQKYEKCLAAETAKGVTLKGLIAKKVRFQDLQESKLKVAKAGDRKMTQFNQQLAVVEQEGVTEIIATTIDLDKGQLDAIGDNWKKMDSKRHRNQSIVESDKD